jgi:non-specific serine/threonine protein kinase
MTETRTQSAPELVFDDAVAPAQGALSRMFYDAITELRIGRIIGPYRVIDRIGVGGMGTIYRAEDTRLGREVALKFLAGEPGPDDCAAKRFEREARAAASVSHPNICTIHEVGHDEGTPFIVMELLKGKSLRHRLYDGPLPMAELLDIAIPVADALDSVHERGFIHRDLTPANIFITERGVPKLVDFGLATRVRPRDGERVAVTDGGEEGEPQIIAGTPGYMSPEQIRGLPLDPRSDLFSLGAVVCEMAVGHTAFDGSATGTRLERVLAHAPQPTSPIGRNSSGLSAVITKALMKEPDRRYQSALEFMSDLRRLQEGLQRDPAAERRLRIRPTAVWRRPELQTTVDATR